MMITISPKFVIFLLDEQRYALFLEVVDRVFPGAEFTPLPQAPDIVLSVINLHGEVVPVLNVRRRFRLPEREPGLSEHLPVARTARRAVVMLVDEIRGVVSCLSTEVVTMDSVTPDQYLEGVVKFSDGLILIHDLDRFLSL